MKTDMSAKTVSLLITAILLIWGMAFQIGRMVERQTNPVCHSITEDSDITDCYYQKPNWYRK